MKIKILMYPRGNRGGVVDGEVCPTITTSSWDNNYFIIEYETESDTDRELDT